MTDQIKIVSQSSFIPEWQKPNDNLYELTEVVEVAQVLGVQPQDLFIKQKLVNTTFPTGTSQNHKAILIGFDCGSGIVLTFEPAAKCVWRCELSITIKANAFTVEDGRFIKVQAYHQVFNSMFTTSPQRAYGQLKEIVAKYQEDFALGLSVLPALSSGTEE